MKRIKRIVALALATVMMMAMSIVSFAAENGTTVTINNFPTAANGSTVNAYQIASVNSDNKIEVAQWAADAGYTATAQDGTTSVLEMTPADAKKLGEAFKADTKVDATATVTNGVATFTGLKAGAYFFKVNFDGDLEFNTMVAVTVTTDANGNYVAKDTESLTAKSEPKKVQKSEDDKYSTTVTGKEIGYTVKSTIPYVGQNEVVTRDYSVHDEIHGGAYAVNADGKLPITVKYGDVIEEKTVDVVNNAFALNLNYVLANNAHANEEIEISYKAIALDVKVYNDAYVIPPSHEDGDDFEKTTVYNYNGKLIVNKLGDDNKALKGAEFEILKKVGEDKYEYAILDAKGMITAWTADEKKASAIVTDDKGQASAFGFDVADEVDGKLVKNTYFFKESKAPEGYSINPALTEVSFDGEVSLDQQSANEEFVGNATIVDTKLIQLPFTGGIGTTIFTILGVAIMAIAAALYFATKKRA
ncbi:MAG: SpaH/EbpB family LPXTG-anchored major pilin [Pseudobutyrivibrio sp.]|nr:SpaH/EbpB family LPXTG-anchored major pilin [Pseudobutyrivibrio sp.]